MLLNILYYNVTVYRLRVYGVDNILEMWCNHFEQLYNSVQNNGARNVFNEQLHAGSEAKYAVSFTISDVIDVIRKQNLAKRLDLVALQLRLLYTEVINLLFIFVLC